MEFDDRVTAKRYGQEILSIVSRYRRGSQFLMTPHVAFAKEPLGKWLAHPNGGILSIPDLQDRVIIASNREEAA